MRPPCAAWAIGFFLPPPSFYHFLPPRGGNFRRGEVSLIRGGGIKGGGNFFSGGGNNQKYCMVMGGDEGSREAGWGYSGKCVIASGWVGEDSGVWCLVCFVQHVLD